MESERYKIKIINHSKIDNHTEYEISIEKNGISFSFKERYSNLKNLNDLMRKATNNNTFPKFPPKKFFGGEVEKFIIKRQQELNYYFDIICKNQEFSSLPPLIKFIEEKKQKYGSSNSSNIKNNSQTIETPSKVVPVTPPKKDLKTPPSKELNKSEINDIKKKDVDYSKLVNDYTSQFYDMNSYYDKEMISENQSFVKYFKNKKLDINDSNTTLDSGNENNFIFICQNDNILEDIEINIKEKLKKSSDLYQSFEEIYGTNEIIVPV